MNLEWLLVRIWNLGISFSNRVKDGRGISSAVLAEGVGVARGLRGRGR